MKTPLLLLPLLLLTSAASALNITFAWDPNPANQQVTAFRFYDVTAGGRVLVGTVGGTVTNITLTNYVATGARDFMVTCTNLLGESLPSNTVTVPAGATAPTNITLRVSMIEVPVPSVIEISRDLATWRERIRLDLAADGKVGLALVQYPDQPAWFMREKTLGAGVPAVPGR